MANLSSDGAIVLKTRVDTSGVESGMKRIKTSASNYSEEIEEASQIGSEGLDDIADKTDKVKRKTDDNTRATEKYGKKSEKSYKGVKSAIGGIATAVNALGLTLALREFIAFSNETGKAASTTEASVIRLSDIYGDAAQAVGDYIEENARAIGMSKSAAASFSAVYGNLFSVWADQNTNAQLTNDYLNMTAVVATKTGRTMEDVQERIRSGLLGNTEAVEDLGIFVNVKTIEMTEAFQRLADGRSWEQLTAHEQSQIRTLAIMEQATKKYGNEVMETETLVRARYQAAYEDFKNTWGQVVNTVLVPLLKVATQFFDILTIGLQTIAGLSGKTVDPSLYSSAISNSVKNQKALTDAVEETADAQQKSLAGFDTLNVLTSNNADTQSKEAAELGSAGNAKAKSSTNKNAKEASALLRMLMAVAGAALVAIGILILVYGGPMLIGLGIGFIIAGAALFAVSVASISKFNTDDIKTTLLTILGIVAGLALVIGVLMLVMGGPVLKAIGLGLVVGGIGVLGISAAQLAAGEVEKETAKTINKILAIVSAALLVIGILLCCFGVSLPIGIALIAVGAVGLATVVAVNWNAIKDKVKSIFKAIGDWCKTWGLLVLGIILTLSGNFVWGIPLIVAGAKSLTKAQDPLWTGIVDKVKYVWGRVKDYWNKNIAPVFTKQWWANKAKNIGNGLISGLESAINGIIGMFESLINFVIGGFNKISFEIPDKIMGIKIPVIGGKSFGINMPEVNLSRVSIPRLAKGGIVPYRTVAEIGEAGREAVLPLENNTEWMDILAEKIASRSGGLNMNISGSGSWAQFMRFLKIELEKENTRATVWR